MNKVIKKISIKLLGVRAAYRIGRALYMYARGDLPNNMFENGECLVQQCVVAAWQAASKGCPLRLVIFDVGANIGEWSRSLLNILAEWQSPNTDIYCFEPVPATNVTLQRNLPVTSFLHFEALALSSKSGSADIFVSEESDCGTNSLHDDGSVLNKRPISIKLSTVADFCIHKGIDHIHLIKSDTEGHDLQVIIGALPLLRCGRVSVLQFEYNHRWIISGNFLRDVFDEIEGLPYSLAKLQSDHLLIFSKWHPELDKFFEGNYVLIHENAVSWFPVKFGYFDGSNTQVTSLSQ